MSDTIISVYLNRKIDDQRSVRWKADDDSIVEAWASTLHEQNLRGVIITDCCSEAFCKRWSSVNLSFDRYYEHPEKLAPRPPAWASVLEERFFLLDQALRYRDPDSRVFATDLSDVTFHGNPFPLIPENGICVGSEEGDLLDNEWMVREWEGAFGTRPPSGTIYNAGILGGTVRNLSRLVARVWALCERYRPGNDMPLLNYAIRQDWQGRVVTGRPLHSRFKAFETGGDYCIAHK